MIYLVAALALSIGLNRAGIASRYSDPVSHLRAQDEAIYANSATGLAERGGWLTPKVMGRFLLFKPPLLVWLAGASLKLFGISLWALRLPVVLAAAGATTLMFYWFGGWRDARSWAVFLLLLSNPLWHIFARLCYTDMLLAASFAGALFCLHRDPQLASRRMWIGFAAAASAGIMAKNIGGLLPLLTLLLYTILAAARGGQRPTAVRILQLCGIVALLTAPWHLYQWMVHREWFWADYIGVQILGFGIKPPAQNALEGQVGFYAGRLAQVDPVLVLLFLAGLPVLLHQAWKKRDQGAMLLISWLVVMISALLAFRFRNLPYAVSLIPVLCLIAARILNRRAWIFALCAVFVVKGAFPDRAWGLPFSAPPPIPEAKALRDYWQRGRPNELVLVSPADEFYSFNLPGLKVHYCFYDPAGLVSKYAPHYVYLGITLTAEQFLQVDRLRPGYERRLGAWGLPSGDPIASAIVVNSEDEVQRLVKALPDTDFELPEIWAGKDGTRDRYPASPGRVFLLARNPAGTRTVQRLSLPESW